MNDNDKKIIERLEQHVAAGKLEDTGFTVTCRPSGGDWFKSVAVSVYLGYNPELKRGEQVTVGSIKADGTPNERLKLLSKHENFEIEYIARKALDKVKSERQSCKIKNLATEVEKDYMLYLFQVAASISGEAAKPGAISVEQAERIYREVGIIERALKSIGLTRGEVKKAVKKAEKSTAKAKK